ncbi:hypothetical protein F0236_22650 [Vibrio splendidus]|nr:hypothetical protein [Vibrio splendidus]
MSDFFNPETAHLNASFVPFAITDITICRYTLAIGMKELKKVRNQPNSYRTLDFKHNGNVVNANSRHYVKVKTKAGDDFYTLTKWIKN